MSISQEQIKNIIANLSKLSTTNEKQYDDLAKIIEYMDILSEVDTTWVKSTVAVSNSIKDLRKDEKQSSISPEALLACANQSVVARQIALNNIMN